MLAGGVPAAEGGGERGAAAADAGRGGRAGAAGDTAGQAGGDYTSGKARVPLYTVDVDADEGGLTVLHDWRGAPELLQYV